MDAFDRTATSASSGRASSRPSRRPNGSDRTRIGRGSRGDDAEGRRYFGRVQHARRRQQLEHQQRAAIAAVRSCGRRDRVRSSCTTIASSIDDAQHHQDRSGASASGPRRRSAGSAAAPTAWARRSCGCATITNGPSARSANTAVKRIQPLMRPERRTRPSRRRWSIIATHGMDATFSLNPFGQRRQPVVSSRRRTKDAADSAPGTRARSTPGALLRHSTPGLIHWRSRERRADGGQHRRQHDEAHQARRHRHLRVGRRRTTAAAAAAGSTSTTRIITQQRQHQHRRVEAREADADPEHVHAVRRRGARCRRSARPRR